MSKNTTLEFSTLDYMVITLTLLLLLSSWVYIIANYANLPETIAVHFDGKGQPNGYNSKSSIWIAPILFTALAIGFMLGAKNPKLLDISNKITNKKEEIASSKILLLSSLLLSVILVIIVFSMIHTSLHKNATTNWIVPSLVISIGMFFVAYIYIYLKSKK